MQPENDSALRPADEGPIKQLVDDSILSGTKLDLLLSYCQRGWKLLPIWEIRPDGQCACSKVNCAEAGKHPCGPLAPNGLINATSDEGIVRLWHTRRPTLNWAWAQDEDWTLDVDPKNGFTLEMFDDWETLFDFALPPTLIQRSGGNGRHVVMAQIDGKRIRNGSLRFNGHKVDGLDVKGVGGYILVEPSNHVSGGTYQWLTDPRSTDVLRPPSELVELLTQGGGNSGPREPVNVEAIFEGVKHGSRDITVRDYVRSMRARNFKYVEALAMLEIVCARMEPPFDIDDATYKLNRCWDKFPAGKSMPKADLTPEQENFARNALKRWNRGN